MKCLFFSLILFPIVLYAQDKPRSTQVFDVVINEIMADPQDSVLLPEVEYIELFNRRPFPIAVANWKLKNGFVVKNIPEFLLPAFSYVILTKSGVKQRFADSIVCVELPSFPILNNNGDWVLLLNENDLVMDELHYSHAWWGSSFKKNGGWSLERIDPSNKSGQANNWVVSNSRYGGTPGYVNSVFARNRDTIAPRVLKFSLDQSHVASLEFSESMNIPYVLQSENYLWKPYAGAFRVNYDAPHLYFVFEEPLKPFTIYHLKINHLRDWQGNRLQNTSLRIGVPEEVAVGDVLINEILFNPLPKGSDYIELVNVSNKIIDLQYLAFATLPDSTSLPDELHGISNESLLLFPDSFIALSKEDVNLPSLPDDEAYVALIKKVGVRDVIDWVYYNEKMHSPFYSDVEGIALERLSTSFPAHDAHNWQSASYLSNYGTPGQANSQTNIHFGEASALVSLAKNYFTPDGDGIDDHLTFMFQVPHAGWLATLSVFNARGNLLEIILNNKSVVNGDRFIWKGNGAGGQMLPMGVYVIYIKMYNSLNEVKEYKFTVALSARSR